MCINQARKKRGAKLREAKSVTTKRAKQRAYAKEHKKKALYNKVRKLDSIRHAVEQGKEL
jgi:hypothetical protein